MWNIQNALNAPVVEEMCYAVAVLWELVFVPGGLKVLGAVSLMQRGEETKNVPKEEPGLQWAATRGELTCGA